MQYKYELYAIIIYTIIYDINITEIYVILYITVYINNIHINSLPFCLLQDIEYSSHSVYLFYIYI